MRHGVPTLFLEEADLLIVLGARFDDRAIGKAEKFLPQCEDHPC